MEAAKKQAEADKKAIDDLMRERDILNKNMLKAAAATQKQLNLVKLHEQSKKTLEQEIQNYKEEVCVCSHCSSFCVFLIMSLFSWFVTEKKKHVHNTHSHTHSTSWYAVLEIVRQNSSTRLSSTTLDMNVNWEKFKAFVWPKA